MSVEDFLIPLPHLHKVQQYILYKYETDSTNYIYILIWKLRERDRRLYASVLISCRKQGQEDRTMALQRIYYKDRYNERKVWEVTKLNGGYYLRQYVSGRQAGRGLRTTKKFIKSIGIFDFEIIEKQNKNS